MTVAQRQFGYVKGKSNVIGQFQAYGSHVCMRDASGVRVYGERRHFSFLALCIMDTTEEKRQAIINMYQTGQFSNRRIATMLQIPRATVNRIITLWRERGSTRSRRFDRPPTNRQLSARTERYLVRESRANPQLTARQVQQQHGGEALNVTVRHVRRVLHQHGLVARRPVPGPSLTPRRMRARLNWAKEHEHWSEEDWSKVNLSCSWHETCSFNVCFFTFSGYFFR